MSEAPEAPTEVVRWFTRARRFPHLIGKTPDGTRLIGGPYTVSQVIVAATVFVLGYQTMGLWASYGLVGNHLILGGTAWGASYLMGKVPLGSRNPVAVLSGAVRAMTAPKLGHLAGRPLRLKSPTRLQHRITVRHPLTITAAAESIAASTNSEGERNNLLTSPPPTPPVSTQAEQPTAPLTGVQALLASATTSSKE